MEDAESERAEASSTPPEVTPLSMPPSVEHFLPDAATGSEWAQSGTPEGEWYLAPDEARHDPVSRRRRSIAAVLLAVLLAGVVGGAIGLAVGSREPRVTVPGAFNLPPGISKTLTPTVVDIDTSVDEGNGVGEAAGSGMILTSSGEVLTNNHVIENAARISVLIFGRARPVPARVVGVDIAHDVALLQLSGTNSLPHVTLGNSANLKIGEGVVAIGNALGLGGPPAVTGGAVAALNQSITATSEVMGGSERLNGLIETDAQIQPGDSGGPLVDTAGRVVGMDTAAASNDDGGSIGFAIPINQALGIADNIEKGIARNGIIVGLSAFLGVDVQGVTSGSGGATATGAFVTAVIPGGPAAAAGLVAGDTITAVDGKVLTSDRTSLPAILHTLKPGTPARLRVVGPKGATSTVPVVLGSIPL